MKWWFIAGGVLLALLLLLGIAISFLGQDTADAPVDLRHTAEVSVVLTKTGYVPDAIRITKGARVTFTTDQSASFWPASNPHPDHTIYPAFDPMGPVAASSSWSFVFDRIGTWGYHDHLQSYLIGTIYVEE